MWRYAYLFLFLPVIIHRTSFSWSRHTTIRNPTKLLNSGCCNVSFPIFVFLNHILFNKYISRMVGRWLGKGAADGSHLQDCGSVACGGGGGRSSWPGLEQAVYVNVLCDHYLLETLISKPGCEPALSSDGAVAELQHGDGVAGWEGGWQFTISGLLPVCLLQQREVVWIIPGYKKKKIGRSSYHLDMERLIGRYAYLILEG